MAKKPGLANLAFSAEVLRLVAPAYSLPVVSLVASLLTGIEVLGQVWYWLFLPAGGLHALLTLSVAGAAAEVGPPESNTEDRREQLQRGFMALKCAEGIKALDDLVDEYSQLQPTLERRKETDPTAVAHIPALADETYGQGLSVLEDVLDLTRAIGADDRERLQQSIGALEKEIKLLGSDPSQAERVRVREERLASQKERLEILKREQLLVDELISQSDRCGASLQRVRLELAAMRADDSGDSVRAVTETLRKTIDNARGVQAELRRLGT